MQVVILSSGYDLRVLEVLGCKSIHFILCAWMRWKNKYLHVRMLKKEKKKEEI